MSRDRNGDWTEDEPVSANYDGADIAEALEKAEELDELESWWTRS